LKDTALVAPSLLAANFLELGNAVKMVNESSADWLHIDVMDGRFVPNISYGMPVIAPVKKASAKPLDVHLMIVEPEQYVPVFHRLGADHITVHYEACIHLHRNIQQIRSLGIKAGVALNPHTPVLLLQDILQDLDIVLIMSVNPGFGGQQFIPHSLHKIRELRKMIDHAGLPTLIEVDGGVDVENAAAIVDAGADVLVAGSTVFGAADPKKVIASLKNHARHPRTGT
jgi:ribulose-phosphate 3-epimerase